MLTCTPETIYKPPQDSNTRIETGPMKDQNCIGVAIKTHLIQSVCQVEHQLVMCTFVRLFIVLSEAPRCWVFISCPFVYKYTRDIKLKSHPDKLSALHHISNAYCCATLQPLVSIGNYNIKKRPRYVEVRKKNPHYHLYTIIIFKLPAYSHIVSLLLLPGIPKLPL